MSDEPHIEDWAFLPVETVVHTPSEIREISGPGLLRRMALHSRDPDDRRWRALLTSLRAESSGARSKQGQAFLDAWSAAREVEPNLRRPAVGWSEDGLLQASWAFEDLPGRTFSLEIQPDGKLAWFFRDLASNKVVGSEEDVARLPDLAVAELTKSFVARRRGLRG